MLDVMHRGFVIVEKRIMRVPMRHLRLVSRAGIVFFTAQLGGLLMMMRRLLVVGRGRGVVCGAADFTRRGLDNAQRSDGNAGAGIRWFRQIAQMMASIVSPRLVSIFQPQQSVAMSDQSLMRGVGIVFPVFIVPRRFVVIVGSLRVMPRSRSVVLGCHVVLGHDVSNADRLSACAETLILLILSAEHRNLLKAKPTIARL